MLALRLVLDTSIYVSATLKPRSLPRTVLLLAITRPARLYLSPPMLARVASVLARPELAIRKGLRRQLLDLLAKRSIHVKPLRKLHIAADPADDMFLECAETARADYLITGNPRHFPPFWKSTKIISPRDFLSLAAPHLLPLR
jgi:putative PIN family toxin of toxin-antitoxin system